MEEGNRTEGLSLTLTAGIAAGALLHGSLSPFSAYRLSAVLSAFFPVLPLAALRLRERRTCGPGFLAALFFVTGIFCALAGMLPGAPSYWEFPARTAERLRLHITSLSFPHEGTGALLCALLTGDRSSLGHATVRVFRESGASHLLALSGLHAGVLYLVVNRLLAWTGHTPRMRRLRAVALLALAGFYTIMTGASPSIVRAFLYIVINELCTLTGRSRHPGKVLCLALTVQLVFAPGVIRSTGFQLSYLAMTGILLLYPRLAAWWPADGRERFRPLRRIWNAAALAISCQLFTGPLAWWRFGSFPRHFLLTNLLAVPLTGALLAASFLLLLPGAGGGCPAWALAVVDALASALVRLLDIISQM